MPQKQQTLRRYIIMSSEGYLGASLTADNFKPSASTVAVAPRAEAAAAPQMRVLDSLHENGPKLVEMPPETQPAAQRARAENRAGGILSSPMGAL